MEGAHGGSFTRDRARSTRARAADWLANLDLGSEPLGAVPKPQDSKALPFGEGPYAFRIDRVWPLAS